MASTYERRNERVIKKAFSRWTDGLDGEIERSLVQTMKDGMLYALGAHDDTHRMHTILGDTYGWMVVHNGIEVERGLNEHHVHSNNDAENAHLALDSCLHECPKSGFVGIVLASMEPVSYYAFAAEAEYLRAARKESKKEFLNLMTKHTI